MRRSEPPRSEPWAWPRSRSHRPTARRTTATASRRRRATLRRPHVGRAPRTLRLYGAAAGLVAAFAALATAELVAGTRNDLQSPVLDVGDRVVDAVPRPVKDLAIEWFGTKDKVALLAGIGGLLAVYALIVGIVAVGRRWKLAIVGVAAFGVIGAYASQTTRRATEWYAVLPSLIGGASARWRSCGSAASCSGPLPLRTPAVHPRWSQARTGRHTSTGAAS